MNVSTQQVIAGVSIVVILVGIVWLANHYAKKDAENVLKIEPLPQAAPDGDHGERDLAAPDGMPTV